jgi:hypothetical protein
MPDVGTLQGVLEAKLVGMLLGFPGICFLTAPNLPPSHRYTSHLCANQHIKSSHQQASIQTHLLIHRIQAKSSLQSLLPASSFFIVSCTINPHPRPPPFTPHRTLLPQYLEE